MRNKERANITRRKRYEEIKKKTPWKLRWAWAKARCKYGKSYKNVGVLFNISVEEIKKLWFRDKAWLLKKPALDRKDNSGNYVYSNCRFIEFSANSRRNRISDVMVAKKWSRSYGNKCVVCGKSDREHIAYGKCSPCYSRMRYRTIYSPGKRKYCFKGGRKWA